MAKTDLWLERCMTELQKNELTSICLATPYLYDLKSTNVTDG